MKLKEGTTEPCLQNTINSCLCNLISSGNFEFKGLFTLKKSKSLLAIFYINFTMFDK